MSKHVECGRHIKFQIFMFYLFISYLNKMFLGHFIAISLSGFYNRYKLFL